MRTPIITSPIQDEVLLQISKPLLEWYDVSHRELPWRVNVSAYKTWVSEIMLQQTRVEAVKPYFARFMEAFPDVNALAEAQEEVLLKYWEGLGYYSRVRNMKKAAVLVKEQYGGVMPDTFEELLTLPGIGSYTAGAIASIACHRKVPAVDGNVLRILSRVRMDAEEITEPSVKKRVEQELYQIMPGDRPGDFNQAMMELGAVVCIPNGQPRCEECPWEAFCLAKNQGCITDFPKKAPKKKRSIEKKTVLILKDQDTIALHKRPEKGLLAGMFELPMFEGNLKEKEVLDRLKDMGLKVLRIQPLEPARHIFTHKEWHMTGYTVRVDELEQGNRTAKLIYVRPEEIKERYPIPSAFAAYAKYINIRLGNDKFIGDNSGGTV